jgi:c-di-GMP-binding flagellar brake protein YcgR
MVAIQIGIIIFLLLVLGVLYQDERKRKDLARKSARLDRFWDAGKERRKSTRIDTEVDVRYDVLADKGPKAQLSKSRNLSLGGINLALEEKLFPGTVLKMQLNVPQSPDPIFVQGEIVWVKQISEKFTNEGKERFFATGIKFTQISPEDEKVLRRFISQRLKDKPQSVTPYRPR